VSQAPGVRAQGGAYAQALSNRSTSIVGSWRTAHARYASYSSAPAGLRSTARPLRLCARRRSGERPRRAWNWAFSSNAEAGHKPRPRVNPRWSLTPRSTPTRSGRQRKAGPRQMVHHRVPTLRRLPTRAALPRTLGFTLRISRPPARDASRTRRSLGRCEAACTRQRCIGSRSRHLPCLESSARANEGS
jgi:hypothetical protein